MNKKGLLLVSILAGVVAIIAFWANNNSGWLLSYIGLGRITGLLAVYFVLWQILFISRTHFLEKAFGQDRLAGLHHLNGLLAFVFIILHPIFLFLGYIKLTGRNIFGQFVSFWRLEAMPTAFMAALLFLAVIIMTIILVKRKLRYEAWYGVHLLVYLAVILAYAHQLKLGYDLHNLGFRLFFIALYVIAVGLLIKNRFLKPSWLFFKHQFYVARIVQENNQVVSLYIKGKRLEDYRFQAGQFTVVRFLNSLAFQGHPFSFSKDYDGQEIRFSIKALGDFTLDLGSKIKVGTSVSLEAPYGRFILPQDNRKIALLSGGIGITPIRSLSEAAQKRQIDSIIIPSFSRESEIVFHSELDGLQKINWLITERDGRLDEIKIKQLIPDYLYRDFYLCGPPAMTQSLLSVLNGLGVKKQQIHFEKFSWS